MMQHIMLMTLNYHWTTFCVTPLQYCNKSATKRCGSTYYTMRNEPPPFQMPIQNKSITYKMYPINFVHHSIYCSSLRDLGTPRKSLAE